MLVYGDSKRMENAGSKRAKVEAALEDVARRPPGIARHSALISAFVEASELVQGLADAEFDRRGHDARSAAVDAGAAFLVELGHAIEQSWRGGFQGELSLPTKLALDPIDARTTISVRRAEGYAYYALYPESYLEAAHRSGLGRETRIIGIRSIGLGLAALVAAALGAPDPVSVRPVGHPFRRELRIGDELAAEILRDSVPSYAVVDEGPGLSGSSFGAVADWLEAHGVRREQIHFFPSHFGSPGPQASLAHRERWERASRHVVGFENLLLHDADEGRGLLAWVADLIGPLDGPPEDVSGGLWRRRRYQDEATWPAANTQQERRKYIVRAGGSAWLVKFAGLGAEGKAKLRVAQRLHRAGFCPEPAGLRHGFLVERWIDGAPSLDQAWIDRDRLIGQIGAYLGVRARVLPGGEGASLSELRAMALHNAREALGEPAVAAIERLLRGGDELQARVRRVATDNRMHAHEWLVAGNALIKTDGLDHCAGHDLVGCQDITWDVAGAISEIDLNSPESATLCDRIREESGHVVHPELLAFLRPCYLAFQLGACTMAMNAVDQNETRRLEAEIGRYRSQLLTLMESELSSPA